MAILFFNIVNEYAAKEAMNIVIIVEQTAITNELINGITYELFWNKAEKLFIKLDIEILVKISPFFISTDLLNAANSIKKNGKRLKTQLRPAYI